MQAVAVFPATREVRLVEHEAPALAAAHDVKLRLVEVGICGTDKEICAFDYGTPPPGSDHLVIGHEALGEVVEVGAAVTRVKPGDLAVPMVRRPCPHARCAACRADRQDFCFTGDFTERGIKEAHGFLTELVVDHERFLNPVPAALRECAVLVEPLTIAEKALAQVGKVQERLPWSCRPAGAGGQGACHRAVVLGAGPVGLLGAMTLVAAGFETYVYSRSPAPNPKAAVAEAIGATYVSSSVASVAELARRVGSIDLVYEAAGAARIAFEVLAVLGRNAVFVFTGVPGRKAPVEVDAERVMRNLVLENQVVFGTVNAGREAFEAAIRDLAAFAARWPEAVGALIARHPLTAFRELVSGHAPGIKNTIRMRSA